MDMNCELAKIVVAKQNLFNVTQEGRDYIQTALDHRKTCEICKPKAHPLEGEKNRLLNRLWARHVKLHPDENPAQPDTPEVEGYDQCDNDDCLQDFREEDQGDMGMYHVSPSYEFIVVDTAMHLAFCDFDCQQEYNDNQSAERRASGTLHRLLDDEDDEDPSDDPLMDQDR